MESGRAQSTNNEGLLKAFLVVQFLQNIEDIGIGVTTNISLALIMTLCTASLFFGLLNSKFPVGEK